MANPIDNRVAEGSLSASEHVAEPTPLSDSSHLWDRLGIAGSVLCVLHCALTPLLIGYLSTAGLAFLGDEIVHKILAVVLLFAALFAFIPGYRKHGNTATVTAGAIGIGLVLFAGLILAPFIGHGLETAITIAGSVILVGAHTVNWRLAKRQ